MRSAAQPLSTFRIPLLYRTLQLAAKFRDLAVEEISNLTESSAKSQLLDIADRAVDRNF